MNRRVERVSALLNDLLRERLAKGFNDPRVRGLITITRVEVVPDLSLAKVYVTVLPDEHATLTLHGLQSASGLIRREIMPKMSLREMPRLSFLLDEGMREQARVLSILGQVHAERERLGPREPDGPALAPTPPGANDDPPAPGDPADPASEARA